MHCREMRGFQLLFPAFPWVYLLAGFFICFNLEIVNFGFIRKVLSFGQATPRIQLCPLHLKQMKSDFLVVFSNLLPYHLSVPLSSPARSAYPTNAVWKSHQSILNSLAIKNWISTFISLYSHRSEIFQLEIWNFRVQKSWQISINSSCCV